MNKNNIIEVNKSLKEIDYTTALNLMEKNSVDYTNTFSDMTYETFSKGSFYKSEEFKKWYKRYINRLKNGLIAKKESFNLMRSHNPCVIPRNHNLEYVIKEAFKNNYAPLLEILTVLKKPYKKKKVSEKFTLPSDSSNRIYQTFCGT